MAKQLLTTELTLERAQLWQEEPVSDQEIGFRDYKADGYPGHIKVGPMTVYFAVPGEATRTIRRLAEMAGLVVAEEKGGE